MTDQIPEQTVPQTPPATTPVMSGDPVPATTFVPATSTTLADPTPASPTPAVGDLCTFTSEDDAGFTTLTTCVVFEVFTEPDEDGNDVALARVGVLPDERIVAAARLKNRS